VGLNLPKALRAFPPVICSLLHGCGLSSGCNFPTTLKGRARLQYIWDYLRLPILFTVFLCAVLGSLLSHYLNRKDALLNIIMVNPTSQTVADDAAFADFFDQYGYKTYGGCVSNAAFQLQGDGTGDYTYYESYTAMLVLLSSPQDIFMGWGDAYMRTVEQGLLMDLSLICPEVLAQLPEEAIVYSTAAGAKDPYPCAIALGKNSWLEAKGYYTAECYIAIPERHANPQSAVEFLRVLLDA